MIDDELVRLRRSGISGQVLHVASTSVLKRPNTSQTEVSVEQGAEPIQHIVHSARVAREDVCPR